MLDEMHMHALGRSRSDTRRSGSGGAGAVWKGASMDLKEKVVSTGLVTK